MKTKTKYLLTLLLVLLLGLALLTACGGGAAEEEATEDAAAEPAQDIDFLLGMWFAKEAAAGDQALDPDEVFGGTFSLYFSDDGKCTMAIDQQRALVDWELTEDGVTLSGDNTYPCTFLDDEKKTMNIVINGVDVLMEKYED